MAFEDGRLKTFAYIEFDQATQAYRVVDQAGEPVPVGASNFAELGGNPRDNAALNAEFDAIATALGTKLNITSFTFGGIGGLANDNADLAAQLAAKQALSNKLTALAGIGASGGLIENLGASTAAIRAIGAVNPTDIPALSDADLRFARIYTAMPGAGVGVNGQYGFLFQTGYPCVLIQKVAGAWAAQTLSFTWAQIEAIAAPVVGMMAFCSEINIGGTLGVVPVNQYFRYTGATLKWRPVSGHITLQQARVAPIANASATLNQWFDMAIPAGLIREHMMMTWDIRTYTPASGGVGATHQPRVYDNSATGTTLAAPNNNVTGNYGGMCRLVAPANDQLGGFGNNISNWGPGTSTADDGIVTVAANFDGARTLDFGFQSSLGDSSKSWGLRYSKLDLWWPPA